MAKRGRKASAKAEHIKKGRKKGHKKHGHKKHTLKK
jgi:hypothetical protein